MSAKLGLERVRRSRSRRRRASTRVPRGDWKAEVATLRRLWEQQKAHAATRSGEAIAAGMDYLAAHFGMSLTLERHLRVIDRLMPYIDGRVLEWGCRHGLDACVYRLRLRRPGRTARLRRLRRRGLPPVPRVQPDFNTPRSITRTGSTMRTQTFDVVTSNGVLEHVHDDAASVGEIHRILQPGGLFVVTCLPNRYSYTEALQRLRGATAHDRLYTLRSAGSLLAGWRFEVIAVATVPDGADDAQRLARTGEVAPIRRCPGGLVGQRHPGTDLAAEPAGEQPDAGRAEGADKISAYFPGSPKRIGHGRRIALVIQPVARCGVEGGRGKPSPWPVRDDRGRGEAAYDSGAGPAGRL